MKIDRITLALAKKYTDEHGGGGGTSNYNSLTNKPKVNNVELSGNKTLEQLGVPLDTSDLTNGAGFITENDIPAIPEKTSDLTNDSGFITSSDLPTKVSDLTNDAGYITKSVDDLTNYTTTSGMNTALSGKVNNSSVGTAGGVAELDNTGKVPSSQLPSYVDDVIDGYYNETDGKFYEESTYTTEIAGEAGKIYISVDTDIQYRWTGSAFAALGGALVLGETSSTAYRGDRGKAAYDISQTVGDVSDLDTAEKSSVVGAINELAGRTEGHTIKDEGTAKTARESINFIDHDITDDSTNDNTDVAPHELTSAEWGDIMPVLPGINSGGIIFDERGTEYVVGQYIHADGTKQPVYQKRLTGTYASPTTSTNRKSYSVVVNISSLNINRLLWSNLRTNYSASSKDYQISYGGTMSPSGYVNFTTRIFFNSTDKMLTIDLHTNKDLDVGSTLTYCVDIQYTKSTDTPV